MNDQEFSQIAKQIQFYFPYLTRKEKIEIGCRKNYLSHANIASNNIKQHNFSTFPGINKGYSLQILLSSYEKTNMFYYFNDCEIFFIW